MKDRDYLSLTSKALGVYMPLNYDNSLKFQRYFSHLLTYQLVGML